MNVKDVKLNNNVFEGTFSVAFPRDEVTDKTSDIYFLNDAVSFQVRVSGYCARSNCPAVCGSFVLVMFNKRRPDITLNFTTKLTSDKLKINGKTFSLSDEWQLIYKHKCDDLLFSLSAAVEVMASPVSLVSLHDDEELTDFELRGVDGGVRVHRASLAAASPVLRRMLEGNWREVAQGVVELPDISVATLRHFKEFIYTNKIPETGLEHLILLASKYLMSDLEQLCTQQLVAHITTENVVEITEFASKNRLIPLLINIFDSVKRGIVDLDNLRDHYKVDQLKF